MSGMSFPGESAEYREARNALLEEEMALRAQLEDVAKRRRALPAGGLAEDYEFVGANGPAKLSELFGEHDSLIVYSYMYGPEDNNPCPMCSAFMDSLNGQLKHITQRTSLIVVARSPYDRIAALAEGAGWSDIDWYSAADNSYATDYKSEMPNGAQVPMCNVFVKAEDGIRHFWNSEVFFAAQDGHPRHLDTLWPLWHFFDLLPQGRGDFMPRLEY